MKSFRFSRVVAVDPQCAAGQHSSEEALASPKASIILSECHTWMHTYLGLPVLKSYEQKTSSPSIVRVPVSRKMKSYEKFHNQRTQIRSALHN